MSRAISLQLLGLSGKALPLIFSKESDNICILPFQIPLANLVSRKGLGPRPPKLKEIIITKDSH